MRRAVAKLSPHGKWAAVAASATRQQSSPRASSAPAPPSRAVLHTPRARPGPGFTLIRRRVHRRLLASMATWHTARARRIPVLQLVPRGASRPHGRPDGWPRALAFRGGSRDRIPRAGRSVATARAPATLPVVSPSRAWAPAVVPRLATRWIQHLPHRSPPCPHGSPPPPTPAAFLVPPFSPRVAATCSAAPSFPLLHAPPHWRAPPRRPPP